MNELDELVHGNNFTCPLEEICVFHNYLNPKSFDLVGLHRVTLSFEKKSLLCVDEKENILNAIECYEKNTGKSHILLAYLEFEE